MKTFICSKLYKNLLGRIMGNKNIGVLAVASEGGHWIQLQRLRPAYQDLDIKYLTTNKNLSTNLNEKCYIVSDANLKNMFKLIFLFFQVLVVLLKVRPDVVISTGAAPGFAAVVWGKTLGAKTIWVDSVANANELSAAGKHVKIFADIWLTQWEHLSSEDGPQFKGKVF